MLLTHWLRSVPVRVRSRRSRNLGWKKKARMSARSQVERLEDRTLLTAPELVSITPNVGAFYVNGDVRNESPDELTIQFSPGQVIDDSTVADGIQLVRGGVNQTLDDADDVVVPVGFVGVDPNNPNTVVMRFSESLPDDLYRITVFGSGTTPLTNDSGEAFQDGTDESIEFELDTGAKVVSVVPQPIVRDVSVSVDASTLNHGDLLTVNVRDAETIIGFRLDTQPALTGVDVQVDYTAADTSTDIAANLASAVSGIAGMSATSSSNEVVISGDSFDPQVTPFSVDPLALSVSESGLQQRGQQIIVYFNNDDLEDTALSAERPEFYQLRFTNDTISDQDDIVHLPDTVDYDAASDTAVLTFSTGTSLWDLSGTGAYRLRIGTAEQIGIAPIVNSVGDAGDSFATAMTTIGVLSDPANLSQLLSASIDAQPYGLTFPGTEDEPGHRDIPPEIEQHLEAAPDSFTGISEFEYNFRSDYGIDPDGNPLSNLITDNQKDRAREIFELYGEYLGVDFVETPDAGFIIATGDLRAVGDDLPTGPGDAFGIAGENDFGQPLAVMDNAESWNDAYGGNWFETAMHEIGHLMGMGHSYDLPPGTIMGSEPALESGTVEPVFPGPHDIVHGQNLYRPESKDIDLYRFEVSAGTTGLFTAETIAERMSTSSQLDTYLRLYQEVPATGSSRFGDALNLNVEFTATNAGPVGNDVRLLFTQTDRGPAGGVGISVSGTEVTVDLNTNPSDISTADDLVAAINTDPASSALVTAAVIQGAGSTEIGQNVLTETTVSLEGGGRLLLAQNDDYFSNDSRIQMLLNGGTYYIGVSASGNDQYDPAIPDSGLFGTSQGDYDLSVSFRPDVTESIVDTSGVAFDGDSDHLPGGVFNFWFQVVPPSNIHVVDRLASAGGNGSLSTPFDKISDAFSAASSGDVVRIVGNGGIDGEVDTLDDNLAFHIGRDAITGLPLRDGVSMDIPQGVSVQIDSGAILQFRRARVGVGSSSSLVDRSRGSLQILGTPEHSVFLTSYNDTTIGLDENPDVTPVASGDWGGILFQNDIDRASSRFEYAREGIFLNWVNHADIRFGGGNFLVDSVEQTFNPLHLIEAHPTLSHNIIQFSADAAISADPDSFEEYSYRTPQFQSALPFTPDYSRVGPDIHDNILVGNSINGLFVSIQTPAASTLRELTVPGRFDDTDIVHVISENLIVAGNPGGPIVDAAGPDVSLVTLTAGGGGSLNGTYHYQLVLVDADGFESPASGPTGGVTTGAGGSVLLENLPVANGIWVGRRLYRSDSGPAGPFFLAANLDANSRSFTDTGSLTGGELNATTRRARLDARLRIDPNAVVKFDGSRIQVNMGGQLIAEGTEGLSVILTSLQDDTFGAGGTFDTNGNADGSVGAPGNWGGLYFGPLASGSIDEAVIQYAGGVTRVGGSFRGFNAIEVHQADLRVTNSIFFDNANGSGGQGPANRDGLGTNSEAVVFIRGSQPIMINNVFQDSPQSGSPNLDPAISINLNALNHEYVVDPGRSTGSADQFLQYQFNQGPMLRRNFMDLFGLNGMVVRAETLMTSGVWDDADIVHVIRENIFIPDLHTFGGLRLASEPSQSLVVKLLGADAGITANGRPLDKIDRIGGAFQVVGQPGFPVVFTSLFDDTIGAGLDPTGFPQNDTDGGGPSTGSAGHWNSLTIERWAHDRNVSVVTENQAGRTPSSAQFIGALASGEKSSDENLRLGFQIHGNLESTSDLDVYSFKARPGTEVWFDVDQTSIALDAVLELLDSNGEVIARSVNSGAEDATPGLLFADPLLIPVNHVNPLRKTSFFIRDNYSINPRDPGMRIVLPGPNVDQATYHVRIRSNSGDLADLEGGLSKGSYQLRLSLGEVDETPGASLQFADIRFATIGVEINGQPANSPLLGEAFEKTSDNTVSANAQALGNLLNTNNAAISVAGLLSGENDVDFYRFDVTWDSIQEINRISNPTTHASMVFDIDYADGMGRADSILSIFDGNGRLVLVSNDSNIVDDRPGPGLGANLDDLSRGSVGPLDPFIGAVELPVGTYFAAVTPISQIPAQLNHYTVPSSTSLARLEPVNSVARIAEDHMDQDPFASLRATADAPEVPVLFNNASNVPWSVGDVTLFLSSGGRTFAVDPFTGTVEVDYAINHPSSTQLRDIAMRGDGTLMGFSAFIPSGRGNTDANSGNFVEIDTGSGNTTILGDDNIQTFELDPDGNVALRNPDGTGQNRVGDGMQFHATTFNGDSSRLYAVGEAGNGRIFGVPGVAASFGGQGLANILYRFNPDGTADAGGIRTGNARVNGAGTDIRERGFLDTSVGGTPNGTITGITFVGNVMFAVDDDGDLFRVNNHDSTGAASLTYIATPFPGESFTSLDAGPGGDVGLSSVLYAVNVTGDLFAFDTFGNEEPVFFDGNSEINLISTIGLPNPLPINGMAFSNLDRNLWNFTSQRASEPGHGLDPSFDGHRTSTGLGGVGGTNSLQFGTGGTYDFAGGAFGSSISNTFSLEGYSSADQPHLYFTYHLETEGDAFAFDQSPPGMRDSLRVSVGLEDGTWVLVGTNNARRTAAPFDDEADFGSNVVTLFDVGESSAPDNWRQARVDLSDFAGLDELRLRFDFATAGSLNMGDIFTHGSELRMIAGSDLRDAETFDIDGTVFEFDLGPTLVAPTAAAISDGDTFTVNGTVFEFESGGGVTGTNEPVTFSSSNSADQIADSIEAALQSKLPTLVQFRNDHRINLPSATASQIGLPATFVEGGLGVSGGNIQLSIHAGMSPADVRDVVVVALANEFNVVGEKTNLDPIKTFSGSEIDVIRIIMHTVNDPGPLPFTDGGAMITDAFGAFYSKTRGANNAFTGAFIDDVIIGLAERGEMVTSAVNGADTFVTNPEFDQLTDIVIGEYQLEMRRAKDYGISQNDPSMTNIITPTGFPPVQGLTLDSNRRLQQQVSVELVDGFEIGDATTLQVTDGVESVTLEFVDSSVSGNTPAPGNFPVFFTPNDDAVTVADTFRDAINSSAVQNVIAIRAASTDGTASGSSSASSIALFGDASISGSAVSNGSVSVVNNSSTLNTIGSYAIDDNFGDGNQFRPQGQILVDSSRVIDSSQFGIVVNSNVVGPGLDGSDSGSMAELAGQLEHIGNVRNLRELNTDRLATSVVIANNVLARNGSGGVHLIGGANDLSAVPFARIVNNTIFGGGTGTGIRVGQRTSPTLLNNIVADLATGIEVASNATAVVGATYFQGNTTNTSGVSAGDFPIFAAAGDPLFVDPANNNFYLDSGSRAIDASVDSLGERAGFESIKTPLGIAPSPILAPEFDNLGQLRVDDPTQVPPPGQGSNIFKDRGAVERADFEGPYTNMLRIDPDGTEIVYGREETVIVYNRPPLLTQFIIQLNDDGVGIQDAIIAPDQVTLFQNGIELIEGADYFFSYNANLDQIYLTALTVFAVDNRYKIEIDNEDPSGIRDDAGNYLVSNQSDGSGLNQFLILVTNGVNDPPVNTLESNSESVLEDGRLTFNSANSNSISVSDPDAFLAPVNPDTLQVTLEVSDGTLTLASLSGLAFSSGDGTDDATMIFSGTSTDINAALDGLQYDPSADYFGSDQLVITTSDLGNFNSPDTTIEVVTDVIDIDVISVNDKPSFTITPSDTSLEDAGTVTVSNFASAISAGPANESGQGLTFLIVRTDDPAASFLDFETFPTIDSSGTLSYKSAANRNGSATFSVRLQDDGASTPPDENTSDAQTFTITVTAVNDAPEFTVSAAPPVVLEDSGLQTVVPFATDVRPGPSTATDEIGQTLTFQRVSVTTTSGDLAFQTGPDINITSSGYALTYQSTEDSWGTAEVTFRLVDDGGTANGGVDTSSEQTFVIEVTSVNDKPTFDLDKSSVTSDVNDGPQTVTDVISNADAGAANESSQVLTFNFVEDSVDSTLTFASAPVLDPATGTLTYEADTDAYGTATYTITLQDDGPDAPAPNENLSDPGTLKITVNRVDYGDAPDSYGTFKPGGAAHTIVDGVFLGASIDWEDDGIPGAAVDGDDLDDLDDEDGVDLLTLLERHDTVGLAADVRITASTAGFVDAWIDFNQNGVFDSGEHLNAGTSVAVVAGVNDLTFIVPAGANVGPTAARVRFSTTGGLGATGRAADGEVEDALVEITEVRDPIVPTITSPDGPATTDHTPTIVWTDDPGQGDSHNDTANESYELEIRDSGDNVVVSESLVDTSFTVPTLADGDYVVRVRGISRSGVPSDYSTPLNLEVDTVVISLPETTIIDATPLIDWNDVAGTSRYDLWVNNDTTGVQQIIRHENLVDSEFLVSPGLAAGRYKAWVRAYDSEGLAGDWSSPRRFEIVAPTNLAPTGTVEVVFPTFSWDAVPDADHYDLWVRNLSTGQDQVIREENVLTNSFTPTIPLPDATYRFWVRAFDGTGEAGAWSRPQTFSLDVPVPAIPQFNMTLDALTMDRTPVLSWDAVEHATSYELLYFSIPEVPENRFTIPTTDTSAAIPVPLADGIWRFRVRALNITGETSAYSVPIDTEINSRLAPNLVSPGSESGEIPESISDGRPTFDWEAVGGAVRYDLWVRNLTTGEDQIIREENLTTTEFTTLDVLPDATYRWWVRAFNDEDRGGNWSSPLTFRLRQTEVILVGPSGVTMDPTPTFNWEPVNSATTYDLWVRNLTTGEDQVIREPNLTETSFTPTTPLDGGGTRYRFWVRPISGTSALPWSDPLDFTINSNLRPSVVEPPFGGSFTTFDNTPRISWTAPAGAETYELYLRNLDTVENSIYSDLTGNSLSIPTALDDGNYRVWVRAFNELGQGGLWGSGMTFEVDSTLQATLLAPDSVASSTPLFSWTAIGGAAFYELQVNNLTTAEDNVIHQQNLVTTSFQAMSPLSAGNYQFRVRGISFDGSFSEWSDPSTGFFTVSLEPSGLLDSPDLESDGTVEPEPVNFIATQYLVADMALGGAQFAGTIDSVELSQDITEQDSVLRQPDDQAIASLPGDLDAVLSEWSEREWWTEGDADPASDSAIEAPMALVENGQPAPQTDTETAPVWMALGLPLFRGRRFLKRRKRGQGRS